jgi:hypothetical protein
VKGLEASLDCVSEQEGELGGSGIHGGHDGCAHACDGVRHDELDFIAREWNWGVFLRHDGSTTRGDIRGG